MERFFQDLRIAVRQLLRKPAVTLLVVTILGVGVGANASMLSLLNALLLKPLDVPEARSLVWVSGRRPQGGRPQSLSYADYRDLRNQSQSLDGVLAYDLTWLALGGTTPERVQGQVVSSSYFDVLRLRPLVGRTFRPQEDSAGAPSVAIISAALWKEKFASDPHITDSTVSVNGRRYAVIGVAPSGFNGVEMIEDARIAMWLPFGSLEHVMPYRRQSLEVRDAIWLRIVARLAPGSDIHAASAEAALIAGRTQPADTTRRRTFEVAPVAGGFDPNNKAEIAPMAPLLMVVPVLLLCVAWANAANVLLARGMARRKEIAVRRALGASRARVIRQLLTESALIGLASAGAGVLISYWLTAGISRLGDIPPQISAAIVPDLTVVVATAVLATVVAIVFGLAPALAATRSALTPALKDEAATFTIGRTTHRMRDAFVVAQVAVSLALLLGAGLFAQSISKMMRNDPGFDEGHGVTAAFDLEMQRYDSTASRAFEARLLDAARALPGVEHAALASNVPFSGYFTFNGVSAEGGSAQSGSVTPGVVRANQDSYAMQVSVSPGFFATLGVAPKEGRDFTDTDNASAPKVAIINEKLARRLWPEGSVLGRRLRLSARGQNAVLREVVGVVRSFRYDTDAEGGDGDAAAVFLPQAQLPATPLSIVLKSTGDPATLAAPLARLVRAQDPNLPLFRAGTFEQLKRRRTDSREAAVAMVSVFGALALLLSALGMYGVTSHAVTLRIREIGIRISLGARAQDIVRLFLTEGLSRALVGVLVGLGIGVAATQLLASMLFGLDSTDAITFAIVSVFLCIVATLATWFPARRAARVDPMTSLRSE